MKDRGWISIHRKMASSWIWEGKPFSYGQAWVDILMECNHAERKQLIKAQLITTKRGQSSNSVGTWAKRFGWTYDMVRHFFKLLESDGMVTKENATVTTILSVCNYDTYQNTAQTKPTQDTTTAQAEPKQNPTNNNDNNGNNGNKKAVKRFTPPLFIDVVKRMTDTSLKNHISQSRAEQEAETFINFYNSNGWKVGKNKMVSWPHSVSSWLSRLDPEPEDFDWSKLK